MAPSKKKGSKVSNKKRKLQQKKGEGTPAAKKSSTRTPTAKKSTPQPQKPAAVTKLPTSKARLTLKQQLEKQKQEAQEWKKKAEAYESGQLDKADALKLLKPADEDKNVLLMLTNGLKKDVYNSFKFMSVDEDVSYVISECLKHITDWPKIKKLSGADLDELVDSYVFVPR